MKILIAIPCLYNAEATRKAIESVVSFPNVTVLLIDNGAPEETKQVIREFNVLFYNVVILHNDVNIYVNPAWNQGLQVFLTQKKYEYFIIMNSDLILHPKWNEVITSRWKEKPDEILIPRIVDDISMAGFQNNTSAVEVFSGTPGVFITLNRKQAEIIYPIPEECKVWFGDQYIYEILRGLGYKTVIPDSLLSYHYWSQSVQRVQGISALIEEDKIQWEQNVKYKVAEKIKQFKSTQND